MYTRSVGVYMYVGGIGHAHADPLALTFQRKCTARTRLPTLKAIRMQERIADVNVVVWYTANDVHVDFYRFHSSTPYLRLHSDANARYPSTAFIGSNDRVVSVLNAWREREREDERKQPNKYRK